MKSFNLISLPYRRLIVIAGILVISMAFKNPFTRLPKNDINEFRNAQLIDTVPKNDININIDLNKILADVDVALAKIDFEKISKDVQLSLDKIDFTQIQKEVEASLKSIDWEKMNKEIKKSLDKIDSKKIKIQIEKGLKEASKVLDYMRLPEAELYSYNRYLDSLHLKASEMFSLQEEAEYRIKENIALKAIENGLDDPMIHLITGLSLSALENLRKGIKG